MKKGYDTLVEAIQALQREGYTEDFNLQSNYLECKAGNYKITADDFLVDRYFRFEGQSSADDSSILYAISSEKYKIKGLLVDAYGTYSDSINSELLEKLQFK